MSCLHFRTVVAKTFIAGHAREDSDNMENQPVKKLCKVVSVPDLSIRKISAKHLPEMMECKHSMGCRRKGCSRKSRVRCMACNVYLCLQSDRNCFADFHAHNE